MDTVLGLVGLVFYIVFIVGLAAGVTWVVVKLSPSKAQKQLEARRQKQAAGYTACAARISSSGVYSRPCASATAS